jgi:hypothetical protein
MPYWGTNPEDCDFAFDSVGACFYLIKDRLMRDIAAVLGKSYPEQSMVATLTCLRLLGERFPKNLRVHFGRRDFQFVVDAFHEWVTKVGPDLPAERRDAIVAEASAEFALWEERILKPSIRPASDGTPDR